MKVLHMHTKMVSGGIEAMVCGLVNELSKTNDVTLCTIFENNPNDVFLKRVSSNVVIETIGKKRFGFSIKEILKIYKFIKQGKFDIVHIHGCFQYYFLAVILLYKKTKFIYTIHSDANMENQKWDRKLFHLKKKCFVNNLIYPVTISKTSQESFQELYKCDSKLIYNGTMRPPKCNVYKVLDYKITEKTKLFLHPGRISKAKNQKVLCSVFDRLIKEGNDIVLLIAGTREDESIFTEIRPFFNERIVYLGERNDVTDLMQYCDGFCLSSLWEGLPVSLIEAFATGCVPICTPVGGIKDVIEDKVNGFLSESESEIHYYKAMKNFLECTDYDFSLIKQKCIESFEEFDIVKTANNYFSLYVDLSIKS